uniref:Uncharacterized protein n=1 Tax=Takifugu rubripes TaxID=31033 RepID=A0A674PB90_TAKRU
MCNRQAQSNKAHSLNVHFKYDGKHRSELIKKRWTRGNTPHICCSLSA